MTLLVYTLVALAPPYLAKLAIDDGISQGDLARLNELVVLFLVAALAALVLSAANTYLTGWVGERMLADLRNRLFRHLERLSMGFYERNRTGVIVSRITNDVEALDQLVTDGVTSLVQNTLLLVGTAVVLFLLDWRLALASLAVLPAMGLVTAWFRSRSNRAYRNVRERLALVTATLAEDVAGMRVVQSFTREPEQERAFRGVNERYRSANYRTVVLNGIYFPAVDLLSSVAIAIVFGYGGWLVYHGDMTTGTLFAFALYLSNFFDPIQQLSQLYNTFLSAVAALDKIVGVLDEKPQVVDAPGAADLARIDGRVHFDGVRFRYAPELPEVLHGLELEVPAGTTVALVGHTGAGKSTIAKLLARFYDPTEGRITVDGHDLRTVTQRSLRSQLGIVPQEGFLFGGTVAENIAFGRPDASREEIERAARAVGVHSVRRGAAGRLRHPPRRAGHAALARAAPARRVRTRAPRRPAHPDPRRGDVVGRHRHRAADRAGAARAARRPHGVRDRAPPVHDPRRRPDRRAGARARRRAGDARRAARAARPLHEPLRRLGRRRRVSAVAFRPGEGAREEPGRAGALARGRTRARGRDQRRQDPRPRDGDLRHRRPHPPMGRVGAADDPGAARRRPRVRRRGRRGRART